MAKINTSLSVAFILGLGLIPNITKADEGMWTFDEVPIAKIASAYGYRPTKKWLDHIQNSAVRLSSGCSASFVSPNGLILTNWHCSADCVSSLSSAENDYSKNGFLALIREEEKKCPAMQAEVLLSISDVTQKIRAATLNKGGGDVARARDGAITLIGQEACNGLDNSKYRCDVVTLYRGGQYKLYKYRIYTDVRLVFIPEYDVGFFGGDPDNFNFPRYNLDASFLRAYEDNKPVTKVEYLEWTKDTPKENDLVFVAGNPGSTNRLKTIDQLAFQRDFVLPTRQLVRSELRGRLSEYVNQSEDNRRIGGEMLFSVENSFKAQYGQMRALMDPDFFQIKQKEEAELKTKIAQNPDWKKEIGDPWTIIKEATQRQKDIFLIHDFLEARAGSISSLYGYARMIVRSASEKRKPLAERLPGYSDAAIEMMKRQVLSEAPIHKDLEIMGLELWLSKTREYLTVDSSEVRNLLGTESPENLARRLVNNTKLMDIDFRKKLFDGGFDAVMQSDDPLIEFVRRNDIMARDIRANLLGEVEGPISAASEKIAKARFLVYGNKTYPDATFTLRLSYGKVEGLTYQGKRTEPFTKIGGAFSRATGSFPFVMAPSWVKAKDKINKDVVFDIATTNDIIGGNSGSPLIDKGGRVIGAVFDGNINSLGGDFAYDKRLNRAVSVSSAAIEEALSKIYNANNIVNELYGK